MVNVTHVLHMLCWLAQFGRIYHSAGPNGWVDWVQPNRHIAAGVGYVHQLWIYWFQTR